MKLSVIPQCGLILSDPDLRVEDEGNLRSPKHNGAMPAQQRMTPASPHAKTKL